MKDFLTVMFRRKWHFLAFFCLLVTVTMTFAYTWPPKYKSQASLLLTAGRSKKPFLADESDSRASFLQVSMEDVGSEVEIITSRPVLSRAVEENHLDIDNEPPRTEFAKYVVWHILKAFNKFLADIGLISIVPAREAAITKLKKKIDVDFIKRTNIITVAWKGSSPELAQNVVNSVVNAYLEQHIKIHGNSIVIKTVQSEMNNNFNKLVQAEDNLSQYKQKNLISDIDSQRSDYLAKLNDAENKIHLLETQTAKEVVTETIANLSFDPILSDLSIKLSDSELKYMSLVSTYGNEDRKVLAYKIEIQKIKKLIKERCQYSLAYWQSIANSYRIKLSGLDLSKVQIDRLSSEVKDLEKLYRLNREKYDQILIAQAMDKANIADVRIVEYGNFNAAPNFPKKILLLIISLFFGVVFGITYAFCIDRLSKRFLSVSDVEKTTGLPVLASLSEYRKGGEQVRNQRIARELIPMEETLFKTNGAEPLSILITSPSSRVGVTFISETISRLAAVDVNNPVLLVKFNHCADKSPNNGISLKEAISSFSNYVVSCPNNCDSVTINSSLDGYDLFNSNVHHFISNLKNTKYKTIILDVSAYGADMFYLRLISMATHILLVVGYDITNKDSLLRMISLIKRHSGKLTGCIFNLRKNVIPDTIYKTFF